MDVICRPLEHWPRDFTSPRRARPFKTSWMVTLRKLRDELRKLEATVVVVQVAVAEVEISSVSGWPRADRSPRHPGVIVAADTKYGSLKWVCDDCRKWTDNVHAIALTLERLRLADLYGVTSRGEQYAGWKMLPGPITAGANGAPTMSMEAAAAFVARHDTSAAGPALLITDARAWRASYRRVAAKLHPDAGGSATEWTTLQDAARLLDGLHNRK